MLWTYWDTSSFLGTMTTQWPTLMCTLTSENARPWQIQLNWTLGLMWQLCLYTHDPHNGLHKWHWGVQARGNHSGWNSSWHHFNHKPWRAKSNCKDVGYICSFESVGSGLLQSMGSENYYKILTVLQGIKQPTLALSWWTTKLVWPHPSEKLITLQTLIQEQLATGHIEPSHSPWNTPVCYKKQIWQVVTFAWPETN